MAGAPAQPDDTKTQPHGIRAAPPLCHTAANRAGQDLQPRRKAEMGKKTET